MIINTVVRWQQALHISISLSERMSRSINYLKQDKTQWRAVDAYASAFFDNIWCGHDLEVDIRYNTSTKIYQFYARDGNIMKIHFWTMSSATVIFKPW